VSTCDEVWAARFKGWRTLTDEGALLATFGFVTIKTTLANVTDAHIIRNYRWWTAFGVRASMVDDGLSFAT
jgi:hypothetical protein